MGLINIFNLKHFKPHIVYRYKAEIWPNIEKYNDNSEFKRYEFTIKSIKQPTFKLNTENKTHFGNTTYVVPILKYGETDLEITFEETDDMAVFKMLSGFWGNELYNGLSTGLVNIRITQFDESMVNPIDIKVYACRLKDFGMPSFNNNGFGSPVEITATFYVAYVTSQPLELDKIDSNGKRVMYGSEREELPRNDELDKILKEVKKSEKKTTLKDKDKRAEAVKKLARQREEEERKKREAAREKLRQNLEAMYYNADESFKATLEKMVGKPLKTGEAVTVILNALKINLDDGLDTEEYEALASYTADVFGLKKEDQDFYMGEIQGANDDFLCADAKMNKFIGNGAEAALEAEYGSDEAFENALYNALSEKPVEKTKPESETEPEEMPKTKAEPIIERKTGKASDSKVDNDEVHHAERKLSFKKKGGGRTERDTYIDYRTSVETYGDGKKIRTIDVLGTDIWKKDSFETEGNMGIEAGEYTGVLHRMAGAGNYYIGNSDAAAIESVKNGVAIYIDSKGNITINEDRLKELSTGAGGKTPKNPIAIELAGAVAIVQDEEGNYYERTMATDKNKNQYEYRQVSKDAAEKYGLYEYTEENSDKTLMANVERQKNVSGTAVMSNGAIKKNIKFTKVYAQGYSPETLTALEETGKILYERYGIKINTAVSHGQLDKNSKTEGNNTTNNMALNALNAGIN